MSAAIYAWADRNAKIGSVEMLVDMCEDSDSKGEIFYKMPFEIVEKACYALQEVGKAEVRAKDLDTVIYRYSHQRWQMLLALNSSIINECGIFILSYSFCTFFRSDTRLFAAPLFSFC